MRAVREVLQRAGVNMAALLERHEVVAACQQQLQKLPKPVGPALHRVAAATTKRTCSAFVCSDFVCSTSVLTTTGISTVTLCYNCLYFKGSHLLSAEDVQGHFWKHKHKL